MIKAVLLDIGGTILNDESVNDALLHKEWQILVEEGCLIPYKNFKNTLVKCILSYQEGLIKPLAWSYTQPSIETYNRVVKKTYSCIPDILKSFKYELYKNVENVIESLSHRYYLALAGNAPHYIKEVLNDLGILKYFTYTSVSEDISISKPDIRFFLHYIKELGIDPENIIMIGDRLDNDIIPAKRLGIKTIQIKKGPYSILAPRIPDEIPDYTIYDIIEILKIL